MNKSSKTIQVNGITMTLETGVLARLATSSVLARVGDTVVLAVVTMGKRETTLDYFPLSVEYVERLYAGGKIKGSRWVKREGKPSDDAILTARLIDRSIRPLFPKELKKDIQVVVTVLSVDSKNDPDILAINAVSAALAISKIPWNGPVAASRIGVDHTTRELVVNPLMDTYPNLDLDLVLTTSNTGNTVMVEAGARQIPEKEALAAATLSQETNKTIVAGINEWVKEIGEKKDTVVKDEKMQETIMIVEKSYKDKVLALLDGGIGENVGSEIQQIADSIMSLEEEGSIEGKKIFEAVDYVFKKVVREQIVQKGKRPDGRSVDEIRELTAQAGFLPRVHGSGLFSRGDTQVLSVATLASTAQSQLVETLEGEETKRYMHHYSFPPYSVGETGRVGFPSRREIGHGALAERALEAVLPTTEEFPYAIRVVSEVMASNGSTSQASVVGSTIALMDAGVPITAPVAGIAIGLMTLEDKYVILTDILGLEDFAGDMDFKVAGTKNGITAIQLDVKVDKLTVEMISEVFEKALTARTKILEVIAGAIAEPRVEVSKFAPKIQMVKIDPEKIGGLIGPGGKMIKSIIATTGAEVDVEDDGSVSISAVDEEAVAKAVKWIEGLTHEVKPGETYDGTVKRMLAFGAFVEILPGKEGLVHVSEMSTEYIKDPADVLTIGQNVKVRVKEIDDQGRVNLSMKFGEDADKPTPRPEGTGGEQPPVRREYRTARPGEDRPRRSFGGGRPSGGRSFGPRRDDKARAPFDNQRPNGPRR
jgi:polyribonucleotide nucleotidyltransferase